MSAAIITIALAMMAAPFAALWHAWRVYDADPPIWPAGPVPARAQVRRHR